MVTKIFQFLAACLSGVLLFLSHPPFTFWFAAWVALLPLFFSLKQIRTPGFAFLLGFLAGVTQNIVSVSWSLNAITEYSELADPLPFLAMLILVFYMALYTGVFAMICNWAQKKPGSEALILLPAAWVILDWAQSFMMTGFPWNLIGYSQIHFLPIIQVADLGGVYLVSYLVVTINILGFQFVRKFSSTNVKFINPVSICQIIILGVSLLYGGVQLLINYDGEDKISVALIQDDLDNNGRWELRRRDPYALFDYYETETRKAAIAGAEVVLWGEGSLNYLDMIRENGGPSWKTWDYDERAIFRLVRDAKIWLLMGSNDYTQDGAFVYNTAITISPDNNDSVAGRYAKMHLTPFGEYVPFTFIFGWVTQLVPEISQFVHGDEAVTMPLLDYSVGVPICYEVIFPDLVRKFVNKGATLLATISNDAWFGRGYANQQHFNMAALRAVENRRYLMRCAVSGISGFVHPSGRIIDKTGEYVKDTVVAQVSPLGNMTFYSRFGDIFVLACIVLVFLLSIRVRLRFRHEH
jgi:apolipoprotein N-acyltransferase